MGLFKKTAIDHVVVLLRQVKSSLYLVDVQYDAKDKRLYIAYGVGAFREDHPIPFSGVSTYVKLLEDTIFLDSVETQTIRIHSKSFVVSKNVAQLFWEIIHELCFELENRLQKILGALGKWCFVVNGVTLIQSFDLEEKVVFVRVDISIGGRHYQDELSAYHVFLSGSRGIFSSLLQRLIFYFCEQSFELSGKKYIEILPIAITGSVPKFLQAVIHSGILSALLKSEEEVISLLEGVQKKVVLAIGSADQKIGIEQEYVLSESKQFNLSGLELAYVVYIVLGSPTRVPINLLMWVLEELGDDVLKEKVSELQSENYYGEEEKFFQGLVDDQTEMQLLEGIDLGFSTNLYDMEVGDAFRVFKQKVQKTIKKYQPQQKKTSRKKASLVVQASKSKEVKNDKKRKKDEVNKFQTITLFPIYDQAEQEMRIRELVKELTIYIAGGVDDDLDSTRLNALAHEVLGVVRGMFAKHIMWVSNGWACFQLGMESEIKESLERQVYHHMLDWAQLYERMIQKRWELLEEYEVVSYDDIFQVLRDNQAKDVYLELDRLFETKHLVMRCYQSEFQTWKLQQSSHESSTNILTILRPLVSNPLPKPKFFFFGLRLIVHRLLQKLKGWFVMHGDLLRNVDLIDDICFFYNSRYGFEMSQRLSAAIVLEELHVLVQEGYLRRYLLDGFPVTAISCQSYKEISDRKYLLLKIVPLIAKRHS